MGRIGTGIAVSLIALLVLAHAPSTAPAQESVYDVFGIPRIDRVVYKVLEDEDIRVLALQAGEAEMHAGYIPPQHMTLLESDPDLDVSLSYESSFCVIAFNCRRYPLNLSSFRQAFASAFDKEKAVNDVCDGFAKAHDSIIPFCSPWCAEDELPHHYYSADSARAALILDRNGFRINPVTGYRRAPDGSEFNVTIRHGSGVESLSQVALLALETLDALQIRASVAPIYAAESTYSDPGVSFDILVEERTVEPSRIDWLVHEFSSSNAHDSLLSLTGFSNASFDELAHNLLSSMSIEAANETAKHMQIVLQENVPLLVAYQNRGLQVLRNDWYTGHVFDRFGRVHNRGTLLKMYNAEGYPGGTVPIGIDRPLESLNPFLPDSDIGAFLSGLLFPRLLQYDLSYQLTQNLATIAGAATHDDNPNVPLGHSRYTFSLKQMEWSDGGLVTPDDILYTIDALKAQSYLPNELRWVRELAEVTVSDSGSLVVEFSSCSLWNLFGIGLMPIVPLDAVSTPDVMSWNPLRYNGLSCSTSGPFSFTDLEISEFYEISSTEYGVGFSAGTYDGARVDPWLDSPMNWLQEGYLGSSLLILLGSLAGSLSLVAVGGLVLRRRGMPLSGVDMIRGAIAALVVCSFCVSPLSIQYYTAVSKPYFSWGVSVGDAFEMEVGFRGYSSGNYVPDVFRYAVLEGLVIRVEIAALGPLDSAITSESGLRNLMEREKVHLTSDISSSEVESLLELLLPYVSSSILPLGDWDALGRVFDFQGSPYMATTSFAFEIGGHFAFGYYSYMIDCGGGWQSEISLTNGFPSVIQIWSSCYGYGGQVSYILALELV